MAAPALESIPHLERNATNSFYDSDKYDTDLEDVDLEIKTVAPVVEENSIGANIYRSECRKRQLIPMTAILKYLNKDIMKLRHRAMGIEAAEALAAALEINTTIVHLDLEGNKLEAPGALVMSQVLVYNQFITHVNLAKNNMGAAHPTIRASVPLSEVMKRNMEIKHLNLSDNNFTEEDAKYFALGIEGNDQITELDLSNNHFQEKGAQYIGKALGENRSIERLNLSWNHIRRRGAVSICRALQKNKTLVYLDLSWNGLGYEGSLALGQVLKRNRWLKELNISNNRISHRAAEFIANGLRRNSTLEVLKIGMNPLTTNGAQNIIESVSCTCSAIKELDMSGVPVLGEFEFMAGAIQQSRQFKYTHGGTVSNHDAIGRKPNAAVDPMRKVIVHMQSMNLRPLELFRSMDKEKMYNMNKESFRQRLKNADMGLYKGDLEEVLALVSESKQGGVNATELSRGMKNQVRKEKLEQIRVKQQEKKLKEYHKSILDTEEPDLNDVRAPTTRFTLPTTTPVREIEPKESGKRQKKHKRSKSKAEGIETERTTDTMSQMSMIETEKKQRRSGSETPAFQKVERSPTVYSTKEPRIPSRRRKLTFDLLSRNSTRVGTNAGITPTVPSPAPAHNTPAVSVMTMSLTNDDLYRAPSRLHSRSYTS